LVHCSCYRIAPNNSGIYPTTSYQYDDFGNVVQINPPNYHNPPAGSVAGDWPIVMSYDFFGRLRQKTTPDAQATYFYIYDKAGRMRFMMDANGGALVKDETSFSFDHPIRQIRLDIVRLNP
jgi:YD repeat-containing protein